MFARYADDGDGEEPLALDANDEVGVDTYDQ